MHSHESTFTKEGECGLPLLSASRTAAAGAAAAAAVAGSAVMS